VSATTVIEKTTLVTVIIEPAIVERTVRAPSALTPVNHGTDSAQCGGMRRSNSTAASAASPAKTVI
jgi:hypothetical protein